MHSRAIAAVAALTLVAGNAEGSSAGQPGRANAWTTPHVLTISDAADPVTLNPHIDQSAPTANLSEMTMAWLLRWDKHNQPIPELATAVPTRENGGVSKDGLTITYHLRRGVRWSDGAPFTADDVVFSTEAVNNPANNEAGRFDMIARIDEPDKYTVVYHLKRPFATFYEAFFSSCCANPSLLPKHILANYPNINNVPYNLLPVGIGPFKFERWDRGQQIVLAANPLYWRGRPKLDAVIYKIIHNRDALLAQLQTHKVDMWYQFSGAYLSRIQAIDGYTVYKQPSYAYNHYDFNLTRPVLSDVRVREALRLALNRQDMVQKLAHGIGVVQDSALPLNAPYFTDLGTTPYDPAKANALLDDAGWVRGADGIRAKDGAKLSLAVATVAGQPDTDALLEYVQQDWKSVGVDLRIQHYPSSKMFASAQEGGVMYGGKWDVIYFAWAADPLGDFSGLYGCKSFPPAGANILHWCNQRAQAAMDALFEHYLQSERNADVKIVMQEFVHDVPSIVTSVREDLFTYNKDLKSYHPNNVTPFDNMMNVDI